MTEVRAQKILRTLRKIHSMPKWVTSTRDPFKTLIAAMISQNTSDRNAARAFERLSSAFVIEPNVLANADASHVEACMMVAGLYRKKSKAVKQVSQAIVEELGGDLETVLLLPLEKARRVLMELPGIGPKTADVLLLFCAQKPTIPVDTHVRRLAKRLGFASADAGYEAIRSSLRTLFSPKDYMAVHVLLIQHGRRYCKARNPLCKHCPIGDFCPSRRW